MASLSILVNSESANKTHLLSLRVTIEQEVAIYAFFQFNNWKIKREVIPEQCTICNTKISYTDDSEIDQSQLEALFGGRLGTNTDSQNESPVFIQILDQPPPVNHVNKQQQQPTKDTVMVIKGDDDQVYSSEDINAFLKDFKNEVTMTAEDTEAILENSVAVVNSADNCSLQQTAEVDLMDTDTGFHSDQDPVVKNAADDKDDNDNDNDDDNKIENFSNVENEMQLENLNSKENEIKSVKLIEKCKKAKLSIGTVSSDKTQLKAAKTKESIDSPIQVKAGESDKVEEHVITVDSVKTAGDSVKTSGDSVKTAGDSVKTAGDSVKTLGDSVKTSGDSVKTAGDSVKTAGDSGKTSGGSVQRTSDSIRTSGDSVKNSGKRQNKIEVSPSLRRTSRRLKKENGSIPLALTKDIFPFYCNVCDKGFMEEKYLHAHTAAYHSGKSRICEECGKSFRNLSFLRRHKLTHEENSKKFQCEICDKTFLEEQLFIKHTNSHLGIKPFTCEECGRSFTQIGHLNSHKETHKDNKNRKFKCQHCDLTFADSTSRLRHNRIHTGAKPYQCKTCNKSFRQFSHLQEHERIHSGEKPYECEICMKKFTDRSSYRKHQEMHQGIKYKCSECGKEFAQTCSLKRHMNRHTKEIIYECDECEKTFLYLEALEQHKKKHKKGWVCKHCHEVFHSKEEFVVHKESHKNQDTYVCDICSSTFKSASVLKRHYKEHEKISTNGTTVLHTINIPVIMMTDMTEINQ